MVQKGLRITVNMVKIMKKFIIILIFNYIFNILMPIVAETSGEIPYLVTEFDVGCP